MHNRPKDYWVPVEPIKQAMLAWFLEQNQDENKMFFVLGLTIYPEADEVNASRRIRMLWYENKFVDFDLADKILCRLDMVELWLKDPELKKAYQEVNLRHLDLVRPTCPRTQRISDWVIRRAYEQEDGVLTRAGKRLGMGPLTVRTRLEKILAD